MIWSSWRVLVKYQGYKYEMRFLFLKNTLNSEEWQKVILNWWLYIFSIFRVILEYHVSKNLSLSLRTIHPAIFSHLRMNQSAAQQVRDPLIQISGNRKEPSLVSKPYGIELSSRVLPRYRELVLSYVTSMPKNGFVLPFLVFRPCFNQGTVQIRQLLLILFCINRFSRF